MALLLLSDLYVKVGIIALQVAQVYRKMFKVDKIQAEVDMLSRIQARKRAARFWLTITGMS